MTDENKTLVMAALDMSFTPVAPHRPGTFVVGYVNGDQDEAQDYLNACRKEGINGLIQNAWLVQSGIEFIPVYERQPVPGQPPPAVSHLDIKQGFACFPLTKMDSGRGTDYSIPLSYWVFPKDSMIDDLKENIQQTRNGLTEKRSGVTVHSAGMPSGMKPPGPH